MRRIDNLRAVIFAFARAQACMFWWAIDITTKAQAETQKIKRLPFLFLCPHLHRTCLPMRIENYGSGSIKSFPTVGDTQNKLQLTSREDQTEECSQSRFPR